MHPVDQTAAQLRSPMLSESAQRTAALPRTEFGTAQMSEVLHSGAQGPALTSPIAAPPSFATAAVQQPARPVWDRLAAPTGTAQPTAGANAAQQIQPQDIQLGYWSRSRAQRTSTPRQPVALPSQAMRSQPQVGTPPPWGGLGLSASRTSYGFGEGQAPAPIQPLAGPDAPQG